MKRITGSWDWFKRWVQPWFAPRSSLVETAATYPVPQRQVSASASVPVEPPGMLDENAALARTLATVQQRCTRLLTGYAKRVQQLDAEVVRLRAAVILRDSALYLALDEQGRHDWAALRQRASLGVRPKQVGVLARAKTRAPVVSFHF